MTNNPWPRVGWSVAVLLLVVGGVLGFLVLGAEQQNGPRLSAWDAICRAIGLIADSGAAKAPQPPLHTPTAVAWTPATLAQIAAGDTKRGESVALACAGCHGQEGASPPAAFPTLAGMEAAVIYKQLDDFRADKRSSAMMTPIAQTLSAEASADVAAYYATRGKGLQPGHTPSAAAGPAGLLVVFGDPARGIAPCSSCHGPGAAKLGAPSLQGQKAEYIQHELAAFAEGKRRNDIHQQMRSIAKRLTPQEIQALAQFYGSSDRVVSGFFGGTGLPTLIVFGLH